MYLVSVSQVFRLDVRQGLPVGESSPAASHLGQRLSVQGVALLVIPVGQKERRSRRILPWWCNCHHRPKWIEVMIRFFTHQHVNYLIGSWFVHKIHFILEIYFILQIIFPFY